MGALGCCVSWWERSFPECSSKPLVAGKLMIYLTKLCPIKEVYVDPVSLFKTQEKNFFSTVLS